MEDISLIRLRDFHSRQDVEWKRRSEGIWTTKKMSRGFGDTIAKATRVTRIDRLIKSMSEVIGVDCGCEDRQDSINKMFPYSPSA